MAWIAVGLVAAAALAVGRPLRRLLAALAAPAAGRPALESPGGAGWRRVLDAVAGLVAIHLALLLLDLAGIPWRLRYLALAFTALAAGLAWAALRARRAAAGPGASPRVDERSAGEDLGGRSLGWGDAVAAGAVAIFAALAWQLRIATPDFVYHWGLKGHRFALARGIDWAFLADPLHLTDHPDYPNLLPDLYALTALVRGHFDERAMMLWSVAFFALLPLAARECWRRLAVAPAVGQAGTAALALAVAMFAVGYHMAGGADWLLALALLAAMPAIIAPAPGGAAPADDLAVGFSAALAAASKIEGLPLAACLVVVYVATARRRRGESGRPSVAGAALRALLPPLAVVAPWLAGNLRFALFQPTNVGAFDWRHATVVVPALAETLATHEWHGLAWLILAAPVLAAFARTRPLGVVVTLQLLFYLYVYLSAPIDPRFYVLSSFPRLLFHLLPAVLVGAVIVVDTAAGRAPPPVAAERR